MSCWLQSAFVAGSLVLGAAAAGAQAPEETRAMLFAREAASHQEWLRSDLAALDSLMADEFHFVAMNGMIETKALVLHTGPDTPPEERPLQVSRLHVEPEVFLMRGNSAVVISVLHLEATVRGRALPPRMRILSVFTMLDEDPEWRLTARSITPILTPPGAVGNQSAPD